MTAENLGLFIAGVLAPFLTQWIKSIGIQDRAAQWLAVGVSVVLAVVAEVLTGGIPSPDQFVKNASAVAVLAGLIYRQFIKEEAPSP